MPSTTEPEKVRYPAWIEAYGQAVTPEVRAAMRQMDLERLERCHRVLEKGLWNTKREKDRKKITDQIKLLAQRITYLYQLNSTNNEQS
jgi:hypothetical protein